MLLGRALAQPSITIKEVLLLKVVKRSRSALHRQAMAALRSPMMPHPLRAYDSRNQSTDPLETFVQLWTKKAEQLRLVSPLLCLQSCTAISQTHQQASRQDVTDSHKDNLRMWKVSARL